MTEWVPNNSPVIHEAGKHRELVRDARHYAQLAGIPEAAIWTPMSQVCSPEEVAWVKAFPKHETKGICGLIYTGPSSSVLRHSQALAGALVRNFIDARLRSLDDFLENPQTATVLICPDLYMGVSNPTPYRQQRLSALISSLFQRSGRLVAYVSDLERFGEDYGEATAGLIRDSCLILNLGEQ